MGMGFTARTARTRDRPASLQTPNEFRRPSAPAFIYLAMGFTGACTNTHWVLVAMGVGVQIIPRRVCFFHIVSR